MIAALLDPRGPLGMAAVAALLLLCLAAAFRVARRFGLTAVPSLLVALPLLLTPALVQLFAEPVGLRVVLAAACALVALAAPSEGAASYVAEGAVAAAIAGGPYGLVAAALLLLRRFVEAARRRRCAVAVTLTVGALAVAMVSGGAHSVWLNLSNLGLLPVGALRLAAALWPPRLHVRLALLTGPAGRTLLPAGWLLIVGAGWLAVRVRGISGLAVLVLPVAALSATLASGGTAPGAAVFLLAAALPVAAAGLLCEVREQSPDRVIAVAVVVALAAAAAGTLAPRRLRALATDEAVLADSRAGAPDDRALLMRAAARAGQERALELVARCGAPPCARLRGFLHAERREWMFALADVAPYSESHPEDAPAAFLAARAAYEQKVPALSQTALLRGFLHGDDAEARALYAQLLMAPATRPRALLQLARAAALDRDQWRVHFAQGQLAQLDGDDAAARMLFLAALPFAPDDVTLRKNLVASCARLGAIDEALHHVENLERLAPGDPEVAKVRDALYARRAPRHL